MKIKIKEIDKMQDKPTWQAHAPGKFHMKITSEIDTNDYGYPIALFSNFVSKNFLLRLRTSINKV